MAQYLIIPHKGMIKESLALAEKYNLGFEFNDFFLPDVLDDKEGMEKTAAFYDSVKMPAFLTSHGDFFDVIIFSEDKFVVENSKKRIRESMDIARRVHAKAVIFHTNLEPAIKLEFYLKNWVSRNEAFFRRLCADYPDLEVYMENMFDDDPGQLRKMAECMSDVTNFGVCFDYAHAFLSPTPVDVWVEELSPYIRHVHINDNEGTVDSHLAVGDGIIDWEHFLKLQKKHFPDASVLIETTPIERQKKSLEFMAKAGFFEP